MLFELLGVDVRAKNAIFYILHYLYNIKRAKSGGV